MLMDFDGSHMKFTELTEDYTRPVKKRGGEMKALDLDDVRRLCCTSTFRAGGAIGGLHGQGL
ncbi:MAG: hypothetical protein ACLR8U_04685 [Oscillospiraceae bacterium]